MREGYSAVRRARRASISENDCCDPDKIIAAVRRGHQALDL